ncbi:hypothetical protein [Halorubrum sp. Eb13]|uniref:hypothetical protein n=1 Tax=Halorubrum sp. Eb13 TaxID=1383843 RepID=UPI00113FD268|nr:hypothetical protein [Halorubrum sp. Eb13]
MSLPSKARTFVNISQQEGLLTALRSMSNEVQKSLLGSRFFTYMTVLRYKKQQFLYDAPAYPYKKLHIRPNQVNCYNKEIKPYTGLGLIRGGGWDHTDKCTPIRKTTHYRGIQQRFEKGLDWEETAYVQKRLLNGEAENLSDRQRKRVEYFEDLFYDIKQNGYRSNRSSEHNAPEGGNRQGSLRHVHALEVLVTIGRDGEIYLNEGFHRCAIAKFLNVNKIPVNVLARHEEWQKKREIIKAASNQGAVSCLSEYVTHPDMEDIITNEFLGDTSHFDSNH